MHPAPGVSPELLLFPTPPVLAAHSLVLSGEWEPAAIRQIAQDLVTKSSNSQIKYDVIPGTTHVSILFAPATFDALRFWTSQILGTDPTAPLPKNRPELGCIIGLLGLVILAPSFLREMTDWPSNKSLSDSNPPLPFLRTSFSLAILAILAVALLHFFVPFKFLHIFQGDYLVSFLFIVGVAILALHRKSLPRLNSLFTKTTASSAAAAFLIILLFGAWFELTFYEAWLTPTRWLRFPILVLAFLPWHLAEQLFLASPAASSRLRRFSHFAAFRGILWLILVAAIFYLHSAQFAFVLLIIYFALFSILQRLASDVIRLQTRSIPAAAIFGAILLAGFVLAILPIA
jgi:hypothetical protein